jgi:hypothetical protein
MKPFTKYDDYGDREEKGSYGVAKKDSLIILFKSILRKSSYWLPF